MADVTQEEFIKVPGKDFIDLTTDNSSGDMVRARSETEVNQLRMNELIKRCGTAGRRRVHHEGGARHQGDVVLPR